MEHTNKQQEQQLARVISLLNRLRASLERSPRLAFNSRSLYKASAHLQQAIEERQAKKMMQLASNKRPRGHDPFATDAILQDTDTIPDEADLEIDVGG